MVRIPWARELAVEAHIVLGRLREQIGNDPEQLLAVIDHRLDTALRRWGETGADHWPPTIGLFYIARGQLMFHIQALNLVTALPEPDATAARRIIDEERERARGHHDWSWACWQVAARVVDELVGEPPDGYPD